MMASVPTAATPQLRWNAGVAALLSFLIPGAGQMYKGQVANGLVWFVFVVIGYCALIVPGLILHLFCIIGAASGDPTR
jgi:TM2 domain-containing membrane protein YozV